MIDVTKPRNYWKTIERGDEGLWFRMLETYYGLPLQLFAWYDGINLKNTGGYLMDGTPFNYGEENLYTDYPAVAVLIEDYLYYISVSQNPEILAEYPPQYKEQVEIILDFVKEHHEILSLHWYGDLDDNDLNDAIIMKKGRVCRGKRDYEYQLYLKQCESITPKLKKLKEAGKYHGDI